MMFPLLTCAALLGKLISASGAPIDADAEHATNLINWLQSSDGYFNPNLEMRRSDPSDPTSFFGMFAKDDIQRKSLLLRIPRTMILNSTEEDPELLAMVCGTVRNLAAQLNLDNESAYAPYVKYLKDTQPPGQLPSAWSAAGKSLLVRFLGDDGNKAFPPEYPIEWLTDDWEQDCDGSKDPVEQYAALLVVQRAWDDILIPVFDMMSHRNGDYWNTRSSSVREGKDVKVTAGKAIKKGDQIYTSYNMCEDCGARYTTYGTPEILRDYGFVEQFPQTWIFPEIDVSFRVDERHTTGKDGKDELKVVVTEWIEGGEVDDEESFEDLSSLLREIEERKELLFSDENRKVEARVPDHEWNIMVSFANAMEVAVRTALDHAEIEDLECVQEGTCTISSLSRYENLDKRELTAWNDIDEDWPTCNDDIEMGKYDDGTFELIDEIKSPYQHLSYMIDRTNRDTCFDLDGTIQICDSYRPHYHELSVHNAARYLKSMKRVLWVGGGDSMLLHEFLKYPELELAVGLELDQRVVRGGFKHFGTQPHFDNPKVEWWFGDATKSLMMLPESYFGSFDMVVVDLSETVMSLTVTDKLDVIEALTLLLKPDGVFVKNEFYFGHFKEMFPRSVQVHWYENPVICSQAMAMGSYTIDFMKTELTDHGVEGLLIEPFDEVEDHYNLYHDYARNHTSREICDVLLDGKDENKDKIQAGSPGILFIAESEDVNVDLTDVKGFEEKLSSALIKEGLKILSSETSVFASGSIVTFIMNEGYVVARAMWEHKYVAFDIHFWTSFEKHQSTKDSLVAAVGSKQSSVSDYRVIAGGIFGLTSWESDEKGRGPQYEEICEKRSNARKEEKEDETVQKTDLKLGGIQQSAIDTILKESLSLVPGDAKKVAVLVGNDGKSGSTYSAVQVLQGTELNAINCPTMLDFNEFGEKALDIATSCEKHLSNTLNDLAEASKFDALIIDSTADKLTASILIKIFSARRKTFAKKVLQDSALIISALHDESEKWRQNAVQLFKNDVFVFDPAWYAEVSVSDSSGAMKLLIASGDAPHFVQQLNGVVNKHDEKSGISIEIKIVDGGKFVYQEDPFQPTHHFLPDDYDQTSPLKQWTSQKPLGHQIIFQMEYMPSKSKSNASSPDILTTEIVRKNLEIAITKTGIPELELSDEIIKVYTGIGDGCVLMTTWSGGSVVVLWDGRTHIDLNLFTYEQNTKLANTFESNFRSSKKLVTMLRDEQPRGIGRVLSYFSDLEEGLEPHWA